MYQKELQAAADFCVQISRSEIVGLYGKDMFTFVRNCQNVFQAAVPFHVSTSNEGEFLLVHVLTSI